MRCVCCHRATRSVSKDQQPSVDTVDTSMTEHGSHVDVADTSDVNLTEEKSNVQTADVSLEQGSHVKPIDTADINVMQQGSHMEAADSADINMVMEQRSHMKSVDNTSDVMDLLPSVSVSYCSENCLYRCSKNNLYFAEIYHEYDRNRW